MRSLRGLKAIVAVLAILGISLLALAALVSQDLTAMIVPPPHTTSEGLVKALKAHRYEGALEELSRDLQQKVKEEDLRNLVQQIEQAHQGIDEAHGEQSTEQGQTATAQVSIRLNDGQEQMVELPLQKENGLWKVTSLDPLVSLTH